MGGSCIAKDRVTSSLGKTLVVSVSSAPMFAIVMRCAASRLASPGPPYSKIFPAPPLTDSRRRSSRITSFAVTHGRSAPVSQTRTTAALGEHVAFALRFGAGGAGTAAGAGPHLVRVHVFAPEGAFRPEYAANVLAENGAGRFVLPSALDDARRGWLLNRRATGC